MSDIIDTVFQHRNPLWSHSESETRVFLRVIPGHLKHVWMNHTRTKNFDPACFLTNATACAATNFTRNIHFDRWFCKWEKAWSQTNFTVIAEHLFRKYF